MVGDHDEPPACHDSQRDRLVREPLEQRGRAAQLVTLQGVHVDHGSGVPDRACAARGQGKLVVEPQLGPDFVGPQPDGGLQSVGDGFE